jgi:hypothetical protein
VYNWVPVASCFSPAGQFVSADPLLASAVGAAAALSVVPAAIVAENNAAAASLRRAMSNFIDGLLTG